jgi:hypothetical protein
MIGWPLRTTSLALALLLLGCDRISVSFYRDEEKTPSSDAAPIGPGGFRIAETNRTAQGAMRYLAQAGPVGGCEFEILVAEPTPVSDTAFSFTRATLARRPHKDCSAFLKQLAPLLGFKGELPSPPRVEQLECTFAVLGTELSRRPEGPEGGAGFAPKPPGHWTVGKLFLLDGEAEVFLNLNAEDRVGELSVKDEEYAKLVVEELAKILLP